MTILYIVIISEIKSTVMDKQYNVNKMVVYKYYVFSVTEIIKCSYHIDIDAVA